MKAEARNILKQRELEARRAQAEVRRQRDHAARMAGPERVYRHRESPAQFNAIKFRGE